MLASSASRRYVYSRPLPALLTISAPSSAPPSPQTLSRVPAILESSALGSKQLILPSCESSRGSGHIPSAPSSPPPAPSSSPPSSISTVSEESPFKPDSTCVTQCPSQTSPTELQPEAELRVRFLKWLNAGRLVPLDLHCSRDSYISTARLLEIESLLPRMARDFDPNTNIWHLRSRPHILHEIGHPVLGELRDLLRPQLSRSALGRISNQIVWHRGSDTTPLPNGGVKEPDAGIGLKNRALPTIVIEVGYSESRAKLRLDAHRWLQTGLPDRSRVKRKRGDHDEEEDTPTTNPRPVMLVILISFEGERPSIQGDFKYSKCDFANVDLDGGTTTKAPKPLTVWVEHWRLAPTDTGPATRGNTGRAPVLEDRKRFWPEPDPNESDFVELFATDIFGGDMVRDPGNKTRFKIPLLLFQEVLNTQMSMMKAQEVGGEALVVGNDVIDLGDEGSEEGAGNDTEGVQEGGDDVLVLRDTSAVGGAVAPAEKRQKL